MGREQDITKSAPAATVRPYTYERDVEERQRRRIIIFLRVCVLMIISIVVALGIFSQDDSDSSVGVTFWNWWWIPVGLAALFFGAVIVIDILTPRRKLSTLSAIVFGTFAGVMATLLVSVVIDYLRQIFLIGNTEGYDTLFGLLKLIIGVGLCYLGAATILQTQDDFRLVIPYVEFAKQIRGPKPYVLDTSALIDGRILDIADVGLLQVPIIVPRFVIDELQVLADSGDKLKRARGRRGLDILGKLQKNPRLDVTIESAPVLGKDVDQMLVEFAKLMPATIITTDMALNRVASIHGVSALNLHDLANALKPNVIPGEPITVHLIKPGEQPNQGVGYLEDGTMVVAEDAADRLGETVHLVVTSTMQTSAGRLIFGRPTTPLDALPPGGEEADEPEARPGDRGSRRDQRSRSSR